MMKKVSEKNIILKMGKDFLDFIEHKQLFDVIWYRSEKQDNEHPFSWAVRQTLNMPGDWSLDFPRRIEAPSPLLKNTMATRLEIKNRLQYILDGFYHFYSYNPEFFVHEADDHRECLSIRGQGKLEFILYGTWLPGIFEASEDFRFHVPECHIFCRSPKGFTQKAAAQFKEFETHYLPFNKSMCQVKS